LHNPPCSTKPPSLLRSIPRTRAHDSAEVLPTSGRLWAEIAAFSEDEEGSKGPAAGTLGRFLCGMTPFRTRRAAPSLCREHVQRMRASQQAVLEGAFSGVRGLNRSHVMRTGLDACQEWDLPGIGDPATHQPSRPPATSFSCTWPRWLSHLVTPRSHSSPYSAAPQTTQQPAMSLPAVNKRVVLAKRPERGPITPATFKKDGAPLKKPGDGEVVVKTELLSIVSVWGRLWPPSYQPLPPTQACTPPKPFRAAHTRTPPCACGWSTRARTSPPSRSAR
jgi:hypothetical protein